MPNQLQKAINLAKKTGDRLIVFDAVQSDNAYVVLSLDEYEKLVIGRSEVRNLTEDELLDKINRDIAIWKSEQDFDSTSINDNLPISRIEMERDRDIDLEEDKTERNSKGYWAIPEDIKSGAEEIIEEDRHYLEKV